MGGLEARMRRWPLHGMFGASGPVGGPASRGTDLTGVRRGEIAGKASQQAKPATQLQREVLLSRKMGEPIAHRVAKLPPNSQGQSQCGSPYFSKILFPTTIAAVSTCCLPSWEV